MSEMEALEDRAVRQYKGAATSEERLPLSVPLRYALPPSKLGARHRSFRSRQRLSHGRGYICDDEIPAIQTDLAIDRDGLRLAAEQCHQELYPEYQCQQ